MEATGIKRSILTIVEKATYYFSTKVYPNSKGLFNFIVKNKSPIEDKVKMLGKGSSNGIDTTYFDPSLYTRKRSTLRKDLNILSDSFVFVFVGRPAGDKGINELVQAFSLLNARVDGNENGAEQILLLVGTLETDLDPLDTITLQEIENNQNIIAVGYQKGVCPYFAASDLLTSPSYREGFPNVAMQAGATGLPAIVFNIKGCNEIIIEKVNGVIIPYKNTSALKNSMVLRMNDARH